jgi:hypothetical protein
MLSRADILGADDLPREVVAVPEWRGDVTITTLGAADRFALSRWLVAASSEAFEDVAHLLALTLIDDSGARLFSEDDVKALLSKNPTVILRLYHVAVRLNRLGDAEVEKAKGESEPSRSPDTA